MNNLPWFKFPRSLMSDNRILRLLREEELKGFGVYVYVITILCMQDEPNMTLEQLYGFRRKGCSKAYLKKIVCDYGLFRFEGDVLESDIDFLGDKQYLARYSKSVSSAPDKEQKQERTAAKSVRSTRRNKRKSPQVCMKELGNELPQNWVESSVESSEQVGEILSENQPKNDQNLSDFSVETDAKSDEKEIHNQQEINEVETCEHNHSHAYTHAHARKEKRRKEKEYTTPSSILPLQSAEAEEVVVGVVGAVGKFSNATKAETEHAPKTSAGSASTVSENFGTFRPDCHDFSSASP